jgi:hypothetical protein
MYSWELEKFISDRNFYIGGADLEFVIDINEHPQINYIGYNAFSKTYTLSTSDNYCFFFKAMPIEEAKEKGLVKQLIKK